MKIRARQFELPLRHVFTISRGSISSQTTLIVELEQDGLVGYGEATTNPYYGATIENMASALTRVRPTIEATHLVDPTRLWSKLAPQLSSDSFALCALDLAAHDLWGKLQGKPVYQLWGLDPADGPESDFTIGLDDPEVMAEKLREEAGWPIYKVKLGAGSDVEIIQRLRRETDATFRVDANCGWTAEQAIELSGPLKDLGVEFVEQPLPAEHDDRMPAVRAASALPLIADESCQSEPDVAACRAGFHGVNVKLVKCGGLTPARRMIQEARSLGLKAMVGCMTESTVGISAIAQLLPMLDYVDMDGAALLAEDIATGVTVELGRCHYADRPGCGVELIREGRELELS